MPGQYTSTQITEQLRQSTNVVADKQKMFEKVRYFVAQKPAAVDFSDTIDGFYKGHKVIPGPKANPTLGPILNVTDIRLLEAQYFIRFVDNQTTDDADDDVRMALFTIMSDSEANEYEARLREIAGADARKRNYAPVGKTKARVIQTPTPNAVDTSKPDVLA